MITLFDRLLLYWQWSFSILYTINYFLLQTIEIIHSFFVSRWTTQLSSYLFIYLSFRFSIGCYNWVIFIYWKHTNRYMETCRKWKLRSQIWHNCRESYYKNNKESSRRKQLTNHWNGWSRVCSDNCCTWIKKRKYHNSFRSNSKRTRYGTVYTATEMKDS